MNRHSAIIIPLLAILFASCSSVTTRDATTDYSVLIEEIESQFGDSLFEHAHWGAKIESLSSGEIWYERNADRMFMPASNEKILTGSAALLTLGPEFRYTTILGYRGEIKDSVLAGDLLVHGNGDPTLYTRYFDNPTVLFEKWADMLDSLGIKEISGNVIGIDDIFDDRLLGYGWAYSGLPYWYSAEIGPLVFNENYVDLTIAPPAEGDSLALIIPNIQSGYFRIENKLVPTDTGRTDIDVDRPFNSNLFILDGKIRKDIDRIEVSPSIHNPTLFYTTVLKEVIESKGISVNGSAFDCDDLTGDAVYIDSNKVLDYHYSPPLSEMLTTLMKVSQNLYAENFARTLGWYEFGLGSFDNGAKVVEKVLAGMGIEPDTYRYMDGSGLSRYNYVSPNQIVKILTFMRKSEYWDIWRDAQPIAGVDGTLRSRMKGTKAEGNVRAKTGTISNVRGLSGYLTTSAGEEIVFSFLVNGHLRSSRDTERITDRVLELIANYKR